MKYTLLQMVQSILSDMDGEAVSTISDTIEAQQVASIIRDTFYNITSARDIPEHYELIKLTAASDSSYPTHFSYPTNVKVVEKVWYQNSDGDYLEVDWCDPLDFLSKTDVTKDNYVSVSDKNGGTTLRIGNDQDPRFYTSFDDEWLVFNSYDATVDTTLQESKVRAYGVKHPTFTIADSFTPDLDATMFPYLLAESKSVTMSLMKGGSDPKVEQAARRQKSYIQNDMYRTKRPNNWSTFGR